MGVKGWRHSEDSYRKITANRNTARGEAHGQSVLTDGKVLAIVAMYKAGNTSIERVAGVFGVSKGTVTAILKGWTWGHVTGIVGCRKQNRSKII